MMSINAQMLILQSIHKKRAQSALFYGLELRKRTKNSSSWLKAQVLKWTKEYFRLTRFNGFELLVRT